MSRGSASFHCKYAGPASGRPYEQWREEFASKWFALDFKPIGSGRFSCDIAGSAHSFLSLYTSRSTPVHMRRVASPASSTEFLYIIVASGCHGETLQRGRLHELALGNMALLSADEPASGSQFTPGTRNSIRIPRRLLAEATLGLEDKIGQPIPAPDGIKQLLLHQVALAQRQGARLDAAMNFAVAQHIFDLACLCIGAHKDAREVAKRRGVAAAQLDAVKSEILRHLAAPLRLADVARRRGVSERYVQRLFEDAGSSFTSFVLEQRLRLAWRLLRDPVNRQRKISHIAETAGFSDMSYFHRTFKARYGATPREACWNSQALSDG